MFYTCYTDLNFSNSMSDPSEDKLCDFARKLFAGQFSIPSLSEDIRKRCFQGKEIFPYSCTYSVEQLVPFLPDDFEQVAVWIKFLINWFMGDQNPDLMKFMWSNGSIHILMALESSEDFYDFVKQQHPTWFVPMAETMSEKFPNFTKTVNIHPAHEKVYVMFKFISAYSLYRVRANETKFQALKNRLITLITMIYRCTRSESDLLVSDALAHFKDESLVVVNAGALSISRDADFYRRYVATILFSESSPFVSYIRDMIKFLGLTWHRFLLLFINRYRCTAIAKNAFFRRALEDYAVSIQSLIPGGDVNVFPYLACLDVVEQEKLAPRSHPLLFVCAIVCIYNTSQTSPLVAQYRKNEACELSPLSEHRIQQLISIPCVLKEDSSYSPTPIVDKLFGLAADIEVSKEHVEDVDSTIHRKVNELVLQKLNVALGSTTPAAPSASKLNYEE